MRATQVMQIERWGDNLSIRLSPEIVCELGLQEGDDVVISIQPKTQVIAEPSAVLERLKSLRKYRGLLPPDVKIERD